MLMQQGECPGWGYEYSSSPSPTPLWFDKLAVCFVYFSLLRNEQHEVSPSQSAQLQGSDKARSWAVQKEPT